MNRMWEYSLMRKYKNIMKNDWLKVNHLQLIFSILLRNLNISFKHSKLILFAEIAKHGN